jgi:hypothetical protein
MIQLESEPAPLSLTRAISAARRGFPAVGIKDFSSPRSK